MSNELNAAQESQEAVGVAESMPGTVGFTIACFYAESVPEGTKLYAAPVAAAPGIDLGNLWRMSEAWVSKAENLATAPSAARSLYACSKELRDYLTAMQQPDASHKGDK